MATSAVAAHPTSRAAHGLNPLAFGAIALAGVALAVLELALAIPKASNGNDIQIALLLWITLPYVGAGLIAWWRRPESRLGRLMIAGGFASGSRRCSSRTTSRLPLDHMKGIEAQPAEYERRVVGFFDRVLLERANG